jgi:hypothetical protein
MAALPPNITQVLCRVLTGRVTVWMAGLSRLMVCDIRTSGADVTKRQRHGLGTCQTLRKISFSRPVVDIPRSAVVFVVISSCGPLLLSYTYI